MTDAAGSSAYGSSPTKRSRRTKTEMIWLRLLLCNLLQDENPMTVRQVFYRAVSAGWIGKTEAEYKAIGRLLVAMRRNGWMEFSWLADSTRWMRKPRTYESLEDALEYTARTYRRALWAEQDVRVEVWIEKDALAGVVVDVTDEFDVALMVTRGYPSLSFLHSAAEAISEGGKPAFIYYLGDHDPSGVDIPRRVETDLREFCRDVEITFERLAVLPSQIEEWDLPTRPTKRTDSRAHSFEGESVEVDAIPPGELRALVRDAIEQHLDQHRLVALRRAESLERDSLAALVRGGLRA